MKGESVQYNVLIIDEDESVRNMFSQILMNHTLAIKCFQAADEIEGITKAGNVRFDLVILDKNLNNKDSKLIISDLKKFPKEYRPKKYLLLSYDSDEENLSPKKGEFYIIDKASDIEKVGRIIHQCLGANKKLKNQKDSSIDVNFINPFITATLEILDVMANIKATKESVFLKGAEEAHNFISGVIPIVSDKHTGSFAISFPKKVYLAVINTMLGEESTEVTDENRDGVAELCNQIFGNAKSSLSEQGYKLELTIPKIIMENKIVHKAGGSIIAVRFGTDFGDFTVEASLQSVQ